MVSWYDPLRGGKENVCEAGHGVHTSRKVQIDLSGPSAVPDYPPVASRWARRFALEIWDWENYQGLAGRYCSGQDEVSKAIDVHRSWEGFETLLALQILDHDDGALVVDVGAHVGWYSIVAAVGGRQVIAVEADPQNLSLLVENTCENGVVHAVTPIRGWVGSETPELRNVPPVRLLKIDVEGNEDEALRAFAVPLTHHKIDFVLAELSPVFSVRRAGAVMNLMAAFGYRAFLVPDSDPQTFAADPLGATAAHPLGPLDFAQRDVLFVSPRAA